MTLVVAIQLLVSALISLGGAWLAATLAARFTLKRFYKERMWERKAAAYTTILEALHDMREWYGQHVDAEYGGSSLSDERSAELAESSRNAERTMRRRLAGETWLLSSSLNESIRKMDRQLRDRSETWQEHLDDGYGAVDAAITEVRELARTDLEIAPERPIGTVPKKPI